MTSPVDYVKSGSHLPACLQDFHDQKDVFKLLHGKYGKESGGKFNFERFEAVSWTTGQCYVIDWFLWFMAQRGWTLQRSRAKVDFLDLHDEIKQMKDEAAEAFCNELRQRRGEAENPNI